jgi:hypothetical protein
MGGYHHFHGHAKGRSAQVRLDLLEVSSIRSCVLFVDVLIQLGVMIKSNHKARRGLVQSTTDRGLHYQGWRSEDDLHGRLLERSKSRATVASGRRSREHLGSI